MLRITARCIANEFDARGVDFEIVDKDKSILRYKNRGRWHYVRSSLCEFASAVGVSIADNKRLSRRIAEEIGLNTPDEVVADSSEDAHLLLKRHKRVVVKPTDAAHGNGVTTAVSSTIDLKNAVNRAEEFSPSNTVIVQEMIDGYDIRVLIIGYEFAAATQRIPASVVGDGTSTISELIEKENLENDFRGENYTTRLNNIDLDAAKHHLGDDVDAVPDMGECLSVVGAANVGTGGISKDISSDIPDTIRQKAIEFSRHVGLPVCGVDFIASDISDAKTYSFIEANACPSFGMHIQPAIGKSQPVDILFVDYLMEQA